MARFKVILNPAADHWHAAEHEDSLQQIIEEEAGRDHEIVWARTERLGHAVTLARDAAEEGFDAVVAVGGDGTVHEVVNGLLQVEADKRPTLGVIPVGSGNDFAFNLGLPADPHEAARCVFGEKIRPVDAGEIVDGTGRREFWNNTVGFGFSGAVNIATRSKTRLRGFILYLVSVLETILLKPPALEVHLTLDGEESDHAISMLSICNGPREGGGFPVNPTAVMDDGLISYTIMAKMGRVGMLRFLPVVMNANHLKYTKYFSHGTAKTVHIKADRTMAIHTDGEVFGPWEADIREVEVTILPGALRMMQNC